MGIFVGVDVSKKTLEVKISTSKDSYSILNTASSCKKEAQKLKELGVELVVMESTGGYELNLADALWQEQLRVSIVNPRQCHSFACAKGKRAKTDPIDAKIICEFAQAIQPKETSMPSDAQRALYGLIQRRDQLTETITSEKNRLGTSRTDVAKDSIKRHITFLNNERKAIDKQISETIDACPEFQQKRDKLVAVKGIAKVSIAVLLCHLPELGTLNKKQVAALAGLAPFNKDSGQSHGKRFISGGRSRVRSALYMVVLSTIRGSGWLHAKYKYLVDCGKEKKVAIVACMRSLLVKLNAMIASGGSWIEPVCPLPAK